MLKYVDVGALDILDATEIGCPVLEDPLSRPAEIGSPFLKDAKALENDENDIGDITASILEDVL